MENRQLSVCHLWPFAVRGISTARVAIFRRFKTTQQMKNTSLFYHGFSTSLQEQCTSLTPSRYLHPSAREREREEREGGRGRREGEERERERETDRQTDRQTDRGRGGGGGGVCMFLGRQTTKEKK